MRALLVLLVATGCGLGDAPEPPGRLAPGPLALAPPGPPAGSAS